MIINDVANECARMGESNYSPNLWFIFLMYKIGDVSNSVSLASLLKSKTEKIARYVILREELVRLAAITVSFVESLDRNELKKVSGKRIPLRELAK
jgi:hypothetical protein